MKSVNRFIHYCRAGPRLDQGLLAKSVALVASSGGSAAMVVRSASVHPAARGMASGGRPEDENTGCCDSIVREGR